MRSESTNASPVGPAPGSSVVPRANITSASGHGAACADGIGEPGSTQMAAAAAPIKTAIGLGLTHTMLTHRDALRALLVRMPFHRIPGRPPARLGRCSAGLSVAKFRSWNYYAT